MKDMTGGEKFIQNFDHKASREETVGMRKYTHT